MSGICITQLVLGTIGLLITNKWEIPPSLSLYKRDSGSMHADHRLVECITQLVLGTIDPTDNR